MRYKKETRQRTTISLIKFRAKYAGDKPLGETRNTIDDERQWRAAKKNILMCRIGRLKKGNVDIHIHTTVFIEKIFTYYNNIVKFACKSFCRSKDELTTYKLINCMCSHLLSPRANTFDGWYFHLYNSKYVPSWCYNIRNRCMIVSSFPSNIT